MLKVEIYDEEHEKDLQFKVNSFLIELNESDIVDIKYALHAFLSSSGEQIYCYSAMIIYRIYK
ncbi:MAG: sporulation protein Cse60 [Candidatus Caccosoma sp.]|nr:sporulation protein Cse60 [Candidatus Caccosoma sp.]